MVQPFFEHWVFQQYNGEARPLLNYVPDHFETGQSIIFFIEYEF